MSLISEALRKAQLEAVQQDRDQRRFYMSHAGRPGRTPGEVSRTSMAIVVLASLCVLSAGALLYLTLDRRNVVVPAVPTAAVASVAAPSAASGVTKTSNGTAVEESVAEPQEKARPVPPRSRKSSAATALPSKAATRSRSDAKDAETPVVAEAPRSPARRLERDGFREGETYGSPVLGPLGTEVVLSGITALRGQSVAIINGNTVRAGTAVGPFVVEEIEPRRVRLKYVDITFFVVQ